MPDEKFWPVVLAIAVAVGFGGWWCAAYSECDRRGGAFVDAVYTYECVERR
jgi:hypothetical protein